MRRTAPRSSLGTLAHGAVVALAALSWVTFCLIVYGVLDSLFGPNGLPFEQGLSLVTSFAGAMAVTTLLRPGAATYALASFACALAVPAHLMDPGNSPVFAAFMALIVGGFALFGSIMAWAHFAESRDQARRDTGPSEDGMASDGSTPDVLVHNGQDQAPVPTWHIDRHPTDGGRAP